MQVTRKGQVIEFESAFEELDEVKEFLTRLQSTNQFIASLLSAKSPTIPQISWMHYLATEEVYKLFKEPEVGTYKELVDKMYKDVNSPNRKVYLNLPFGISVCTIPKGTNQGGLYIFENKNYVGKITSNGVAIDIHNQDILNFLEDANDNLLELAKMYGHKT